MTIPNTIGPHRDQPLLTYGAALGEAEAALILVHGRGASADGMLELAQSLWRPGTVYLAPKANGNSWYPHSFLAPLESNEPGLSSGLQRLADLVDELVASGLPSDKICLGGFSQGACLAAEYVARNPQRYGGLFVFSGGVIGPLGTAYTHDGDLDGTPVFIGCSDVDAHIPLARVHETAAIFAGLGARVDLQIYPGMGHAINQDELSRAKDILAGVS